jgi:hypothetical protein
VALVDALFMVLLAVTVAVGIARRRGADWTAAHHAAAAAKNSRSPWHARYLGAACADRLVGGMYASAFSTPAGPTVVLSGSFFAATLLLRYARQP